jgi:hypothetical protein
MKTLRKRKVVRVLKGFSTLKVKELLQIRGGEGAPTQKDNDFD